ncbi:MAG: type II secretion system protein GspL [Alphaproteobacteria bacterium]|nr:type II secretion system protein GspL [Alphaproteobacteria bacterium]
MLILGLPDSDASTTYEHARWGDDARLISQGPLAVGDLPAGPVWAVLPGSRMSWYAVRLPPVPRAQRMAAVQGLLEDQWLQSPDTLHISLHPIAGAAPDQPNYWVCTCDAQWLSDSLQALIRAGRTPQRLLPEFAPVSAGQTDAVQVFDHASVTHLAWCRSDGVLIAPWPSPWPLLHATPAVRIAEPSVLSQIESSWGNEGDPVRTQTRAERWRAAGLTSFDLAQGAWSQTRAQRTWRQAQATWQALAHQPAWRAARFSLLGLVAAQCLGLLTWSWLSEEELQRQQRALGGMLTQAFPQTQLVVDPAAQMQQALQTLRRRVGAPAPDQAEIMLAQLTQGLNTPPQLQALRFEGQTLSVQGIGLDTLGPVQQQRLRTLGYELQAQPNGLSMRYRGTP